MEKLLLALDKNRPLGITVLIFLVLAIFALLFILSPLKDIVFPSKTEPNLALMVVESSGPDPETGIYRVLVEANAEGNPKPQVSFNRNDGVGVVEGNYALLLLEEGESFALKALAVNQHGTAEAELNLYVGIMIGTLGQSRPPDSTGPGDSGAQPPGGGEDEDEEDEDEEDEDEVRPPAAGEGGSANRAPKIIHLFLNGSSITDNPEVSFSLTRDIIDEGFGLVLIIEDADGDEIEVQAETSFGVIESIENITDEIIHTLENLDGKLTAFYVKWGFPPGSTIYGTLQIELVLTASDQSGASDRKVITLIEDPPTQRAFPDGEGHILEPFPPAPANGSSPPYVIPEGSSLPFMLPALPIPEPSTEIIEITLRGNPALSGSILSDGLTLEAILVGDSQANVQAKGLLTFNLDPVYSALRGRTFEIENIRLNMRNIRREGNPEAWVNNIDFKVFYFGTALNESAFREGGTRFYISNLVDFYNPTLVSIFSATLRVEFNNALIAQRPRFQIKLGFDRSTNSDRIQDSYHFYPEDAELFLRIRARNN